MVATHPRFFGLGSQADIRLPDQTIRSIRLGDEITRYEGKVVAIETQRIVVAEKHFNVVNKWQGREGVLSKQVLSQN